MRKKLTTLDFIEKAKQIHENKYDYSKVEYKGAKEKVCIICPKHGEFWQSPNSHLKGCGCFKCGVENSAIGHLSNTETFIKKAKFIFGDSYDYSLVEYKNSSKKILLKCNKCGNIFEISPNNHLKGQGCPICAKNKKGASKKSLEEFIKCARKVHGNKYDYSKSNYVGSHDKTLIICPKHGEFWQTPTNHLRGQGCPICKDSKLEYYVSDVLAKNNIKYINKCSKKSLSWLKRQHLDFYLPEYNIAIECQGRQHIYPIDFGGKGNKKAEKYFLYIKKLDELKKENCDEHGIKILYFLSKDINEIPINTIYNKNNSFWEFNDILKIIKNEKKSRSSN